MRLIALEPAAIRELAAGACVDVDGVRLEWRDDDRRVLHYRLNALAADAGSAPYLLHVLLDSDRLVGRIGCHEAPQDGVVEIGYDVAPAFRRRGVATEMLTLFLSWLRDQGVRRVRASVAPDNAASLSLVHRFGFEQVGDHWDDEDGLELEFERDLETG